ncbi:hypothetical protein [Cochlodiniinecator piscidefendens]|uniref:hypothetical protein n=1 Tax=Cochlodiniinecator piscidefendens TaxID=2715756 RepID=UPI00140B42E8|nr:hypothetical protein [Cochlodiniinecator piscidefendens]
MFKSLWYTLLLGVVTILSGCDEFDGDEFRKYLPITQNTSSELLSERVWFSCAIAGYSLSNTYDPPDVELPQGFERWSQFPISDHVRENSIVYRILGSQSKCWTTDLIELTGHSSIWDFVENIDGAFSNMGSILLIFDRTQNRIFIMEG